MKMMNRTLLWCCLLSLILPLKSLADWPAYRADSARSGHSSGLLHTPLHLAWVYQPSHAPQPAWPLPSSERPRTLVDNAYHAVIAHDTVFFAVSTSHKICALDLQSGHVNWEFYTEGPVRFAPAYAEGKLYVGSDDGYVYCLDAKTGHVLWKYRAGPSDEKVIGNGHMISLWPVRTGLLVDGGVVYFAAGVFPYEGLYICALQANDGKEIWKNDTIGDRAHELEYGGISPFGYPVASRDILYIPSGRAMPAAFDRHNGQFLFSASPGGKRGGAWALLDQDRLIAGVDESGTPQKVAYDATSGQRRGDVFAWFPGIDLVVTSKESYILTVDGIYAIDRSAYAKSLKESKRLQNKRTQAAAQLSKLRQDLRTSDDPNIHTRINQLVEQITAYDKKESQLKNDCYLWKYAEKNLSSLIKYGSTIFAGGKNRIIALDAETGQESWHSEIQGKAVGLAASDTGLVVSSDAGPIYCFRNGPSETEKIAKESDVDRPVVDESQEFQYRKAAQDILRRSRWNKGYALVLGSGGGPFVDELAKRSDWHIVVLEPDPVKREKARQYLVSTGKWGTRVVVEPWDIQSLPSYFANVIVSDGLFEQAQPATTVEERFRVLRPYGGEEFVPVRGSKIAWTKSARGDLQGAGNWTQQYGDPQNSACSYDELVNGPLGILWFGEPGPQGMVERHGRAQSPVAMDGRLFIEGEELIMAVDAYNGTLLWERKIPGAVRVKIKADSGNLCVTHEGLFIAAHDTCYRLNPATGDIIRIYNLPPRKNNAARRWGYLTVVDGILYGSAATPMKHEYATLLKTFLNKEQWRPLDEIPEEFQEQYRSARKQYPEPLDFMRAVQRYGLAYYSMTSFARGGEFTQKNAVTDDLMTSDHVFALDVNTGEVLWDHSGGRIANITIVVGEDKIFFADSAVNNQQRKEALAQKRRYTQQGIYRQREGILDELRQKQKQLDDYNKRNPSTPNRTLTYLVDSLKAELFQEEHPEGSLTYADADTRLVTALDRKTGKKIWEKMVDLTGCCGDKMGAAYREGRLLFFGNHGNHDAWRFREGGMKWRRITVLSSETGEMEWSHPLNYRTRPVLVGNKIILEPRACDLRTGEEISRVHPITGKNVPWEFLRPGHTCGISAASAKGLFYRSACTAFYDLEKDRGITIFGAYRPGCAISVIPACGVLLSPEAAAGCTCSYPIRCSVALVRKPDRPQPWTVFVTPGALKPVKRFAINIGAVADMKDEEGTVWFAYPNPKTARYTHFPNYGVKFNLHENKNSDLHYFARDFKNTDITGTDKPWLFTSGCVGFTRCRIPLRDADTQDTPATYTVRLGFLPLQNDRVGQRVFDIKLQDRQVLKDCDIRLAAEASNRPVMKEFKHIPVQSDLILELVPKNGSLTNDHVPLINCIEIIQEEV